jgi:3-oxoacyl-[acyl-carrier-protein] synthase II
MKVVITGMGAHCALGSCIDESWNGIEQGKSGIRPITRFDVAPFEPKLGGMVPGGDKYESDEERLLWYAFRAAEDALNNADASDNSDVALVLGTSNGIMRRKIYNISYKLADKLNLGGLVITVSTACTSSSHAIGFAADLLRREDAKVVIAGGVDILTRDVFAGFNSLGILSRTSCSPFSDSLGTTLGEGAAFLIMETEENAKKREIQPQAVFMGYGISADAYHDTKPDQSGSGICKAILNSLKDSNLNPYDIDYINVHGTGTAANDTAEWRGIQSALSDHSLKIPLSASKSFFGHTQGAAGALEAVTTLTAMQHNVIPPTLNYTRPRPFSPIDPVAEIRPRPYRTKIALKTNSGFGGVNSALVFGEKNVAYQPRKISPRPISILGYGINEDKDYINSFIPYDDLRSTDLSAKLLAGVVAKLLDNAEIHFRSEECENIGLFVGQDQLSPESIEAFEDSISGRGIKHLSAAAFTRLVINYPAGACCRIFGLKGPVAVMAAKPDNGLTALCLAADFLAWRNDADLMIVASVDEKEHGNNGIAAGFLLKAGYVKSPIRLKAWSMSRDSNRSLEKALGMAGLKPGDIESSNENQPSTERGLCALIERIESNKNTNLPIVLLRSKGNIDCNSIDIILEKRDAYASRPAENNRFT